MVVLLRRWIPRVCTFATVIRFWEKTKEVGPSVLIMSKFHQPTNSGFHREIVLFQGMRPYVVSSHHFNA